ncbi:hypothetical protein BJ166DRAFT_42856 [Pestalotiopsis sp. NC0098]|nr:hypothetical protein BJ166DRAFT_42856 [Pestalotiopsis sp. NC0098]
MTQAAICGRQGDKRGARWPGVLQLGQYDVMRRVRRSWICLVALPDCVLLLLVSRAGWRCCLSLIIIIPIARRLLSISIFGNVIACIMHNVSPS